MKLYFSGVAGPAERGMLTEAGVRRLLVDQYDLPHADGHTGRLALDSGAYRHWKRGTALDDRVYQEIALEAFCLHRIDFAVAPDVIGDPETTARRWRQHRHLRFMVPVWHWGAPRAHLCRYLDERRLVAIGALVPPMRARDEGMLRELTALCEEHPGRFHLLGANWLRALEELRHSAASADTSKWLDGGRYGHVIFVNTRTGHLSQAPARAMGLDWDRARRCVESARAMEQFLREEQRP